ncbi:acyltransferase-like protein At3g26840, chloroplastic [Vitis riparia]|uniref:acyltransferase-like protein At3g26840, chloroplastic n=1 Tax=Vitis riparia TaxID=96939 RepID=UPI00155A1E2B|nr:acyltransferase-like protein At3g26840, chloroplastic [Vitis riparia]
MAATGACFVTGGCWSVFRRDMKSATGGLRTNPISVSTRPSTMSSEQALAPRAEEKEGIEKTISKRFEDMEVSEVERRSLQDYFQQSKDLSRSDGGPPRWFSPLECGTRLENSPLLLFLPGIDGVGLGLSMHHHRLGQIFDIWCLHIPVMDRTPFTELVKLVERTVRSENFHSPNKPIYLVGESLGGCLALAVAARNPDIDLALILANPATSFGKSPLQPLIPLFDVMPDQLNLGVPYVLSLMTGDPLRMVMTTAEKGLSLQQTVGEISEGLGALSAYLSVLSDILPQETFLWRLKMLSSASAYANSRLHAVKAEILILSSGKDHFLSSQEEAERLCHVLPKCKIRKFADSGHFLFLEDGIDLVTIIKGVNFYRRAKYHDYVSDYIPLVPSEFRQATEEYRWLTMATSPVMLSTMEDGKIVRGLAGIPSEGPVLFVGYHMLLGLELAPMVLQFLAERNILLRGIAHPMMFKRLRSGILPELSTFDTFRVFGAVPVSGSYFYKLMSSKSHILLYPGGMREALHRKGEEYKLFWPESSEFIRMAARFGAKIVPFGVVGEDDIGQVVIDYDDLMKIPYFRAQIKDLTNQSAILRTESSGDVANQDVHLPGVLPKIPGRFYYFFGKPIETEGRKHELRDKEKAHELYLHAKSEVESCIAYLKEKRKGDPYRNLLPRLFYQATHGFTTEVPTFDL